MSEAKTILIVDDEPDTCAFLSVLLEDDGFETITAADGNEALAALQASLPDLISLDITMPEKSGVKFYREIKENPEWSKIPIVIVTGITNEFERFISTRKQVPPPEGYVSKPIDTEKFLGLVRKLTAG